MDNGSLTLKLSSNYFLDFELNINRKAIFRDRFGGDPKFDRKFQVRGNT